MKRFACQRLYLSPDTCFIRYVVELGNNGKIQSYYPLEEEIYEQRTLEYYYYR